MARPTPDKDDNVSSQRLLVAPDGYALSIFSSSDATTRNALGPGRIVGRLLSRAGKRVEMAIDRTAERMGVGPRMATFRLTAELHAIHELDRGCPSEHVKDVGNVFEVAERLLWVCNGTCSKCGSPYLPRVLQNIPDGVLKAMGRLIAYLNNQELQNVELAALYTFTVVESHVFSASQAERIGLPASLQKSIDTVHCTRWNGTASKTPLMSMLRDSLTALESEESATTERFTIMIEKDDEITANGVWDQIAHLVQLARTSNHWVKSHVTSCQLFTEIIQQNDLDPATCFVGLSDDLLVYLAEYLDSTVTVKLLEAHALLAYRRVAMWHVSSAACKALTGHGGFIVSVGFSPDGAYIVSGSADETVRIWDMQTQQQIAVLKGHASWVNSVAFSPDGAQIISSSFDQTIRIWNTQSIQQIALLEDHSGWGGCVAFSPDGAQIVAGSKPDIRIWDVGTRQHIAALEGHHGLVRSVAFSPNGTQLVSGSEDMTVRIWDMGTKQQIACLKGHTDSVRSVAFSSDGTHVASGSEDGTVQVWEVSTQQRVAVLRGHGNWVQSVAFSPDGANIASGSRDCTVRIWDSRTFQQIAVLTGHTEWVNSVAFSPDGTKIVSSSLDRTIRIWDWFAMNSNPALQRYFAPTGSIP